MYFILFVYYKKSYFKTISTISTKIPKPPSSQAKAVVRCSKISLENKMLIYKQLICPSMPYVCIAFDYGGSAKNSNLKIVQSFQSINLHLLTNAPWYVSNRSLSWSQCSKNTIYWHCIIIINSTKTS